MHNHTAASLYTELAATDQIWQINISGHFRVDTGSNDAQRVVNER